MPINHSPDMERALAEAVPAEADSVIVVGRSGQHVSEALRSIRAGVQVQMDSDLGRMPPGTAKAVVLVEPLPHDGRAERRLREAREHVREDGCVVAAFGNGANAEARRAFDMGCGTPPCPDTESVPEPGKYARVGVEVVLSRADLEPVAANEIVFARCAREGGNFSGKTERDSAEGAADAWVVCARPRKARPSPFGAARLERRRGADARNQRGEALFAQGEVMTAIAEFAAAIGEWNEEGLYFNNLGAALHAVGQPEQAWRRLREAVHLNPHLTIAWDNLRAVAEVLGRTREAEDLCHLFAQGGGK